MNRQLMTEMQRLVDAAMAVQLAQADWNWMSRTYGPQILRDLQGPDQVTSFARQAGFATQTIGGYIKGDSAMTPKAYLKILYNCRVFGFAKEIEAHRATVEKLEDR